MNFYNFIYKSILIHFHLKKSDVYKLFKKTTLFAKEFFFLNLLFLKNTFNPILIKEKEFIKKKHFLDNFIKN